MSRVTGAVAAEFLQSGGATRMQRHRQSYPLKIAKTFPFPGEGLGVYVMDASPGIMAGDGYELRWSFGEQTRTYLTNQSYTKVHPAFPSAADGGAAQRSTQLQELHLGRDAYVEYMFEPLMLYESADFDSVTEAELETGASLFLGEIVCPGRTHRGELFRYSSYRSRLTVRYDGELIFQAKGEVRPGEAEPQVVSRWDDAYTHLGTLYLFSDRVNAVVLEALRRELEGVYGPPGGSGAAEVYWGVSCTYKHGLVVSALGRRVYELQALLEAAWSLLRRELFGLAPLAVRK